MFALTSADGRWVEIFREDNNRGRFRIHKFNAVQADALRLIVDKVHAGDKSARIFEIRAYGIENAE